MPDLLTILIKGCCAGDRTSQAKLYDYYSAKMMGVCCWYARNHEEAEEILQDGFLRVFKHIHQFKGEGSLEGWIRRIMVNAALLRFRRKEQYQLVQPLNPDNIQYEEYSHVFAILEEKELLKLVQSLPPAYRMVFNLHVLEGLKHREIAVMLGISSGTSKSNLSAAKLLLRRALVSDEKESLSPNNRFYEKQGK